MEDTPDSSITGNTFIIKLPRLYLKVFNNILLSLDRGENQLVQALEETNPYEIEDREMRQVYIIDFLISTN